MDEKKKEEAQGTPEVSVEDLQKKIAELTQERDNVVGELKEDRKKRQELQEEIDKLKGQENPAPAAQPNSSDPVEIAKQVYEKMRAEEKASVAKSNKNAAIERFVRENPEFNPANDTTGARREALVEKLKMFNTSNFETVEQFYSAVRDASRLLGANTASTDSEADIPVSPYAGDVPPTTTPKQAGQDGLSDKERKLLQQNGMTVERYKKLKESMPDTVADLLERVK